jgi:nucleoid DNA-binding protein
MTPDDASLKPIPAKQTKEELIASIAEETGLTHKQIKTVFQSLASHAKRHLVDYGSGEFVIPEVGVKLTRVNKAPTPARKIRNPVTGEEVDIPAKPVRPGIKLSALKALKDVLETHPLSEAKKAEAPKVEKPERPEKPKAKPKPKPQDTGPAAPLQGTWRSDKAASIEEMNQSKTVTAQQKETLSSLFGKLVVTYTPSTFTTEFNGERTTLPYQAVGAGNDFVEIEYAPPGQGGTQRKRLNVSGDTLWIDLPQFGFREVFKRIG